MANNVSNTIYVPIVSPPTPAPSPRLSETSLPLNGTAAALHDPGFVSRHEFAALTDPSQRKQYLAALLADCTPDELLFVSTTIAPMLRRDFLGELPPELALHILGCIDDPRTLARASRVSRYWNHLLDDQWLWKRMCAAHGFGREGELQRALERQVEKGKGKESPRSRAGSLNAIAPRDIALHAAFPYRDRFKYEYARMTCWLKHGKLLRSHRVPLIPPTQQGPQQLNGPPPPSSAIPTSVAIDSQWVVVGLANSRIHIFSAKTGVLSRTLVGHEAGVWAVALIRGSNSDKETQPEVKEEPGEGEDLRDAPPSPNRHVPQTLRYTLGLDSPRGKRKPVADAFAEGKERWANKPSDPTGASDGWGQPNALVVSGGCDKELRVWDVKSGYCIYVLRGHTSTIRCLKTLHGRPLAVSGSRDRTVRVWDVQRGRALRVFEGHQQSVRCLDVCGNRVVSGSYDCTCRVWDVDTGECLHILQGHFHQIYSVAFDGKRIASGGLDTTVRVWDAETGTCLALLSGHTALVCQLQLSPTMLVTGGSDGRVITFSLETFSVVQRLAAHDSSVTGLQLSARFLVTSGNDGRVRLYQFGVDGRCEFVRDLSDESESVWKVAHTEETCAVMCKRAGKTVMEIWSFKPSFGA